MGLPASAESRANATVRCARAPSSAAWTVLSSVSAWTWRSHASLPAPTSARDLQVAGRVVELFLRQPDASLADLGLRIGPREIGGVSQASVAIALARRDNPRLACRDTGGALAAQLDRLVDLERRLLLVAGIADEIPGEVFRIDADRGVGAGAGLLREAPCPCDVGVERQHARGVLGLREQLRERWRGL